MKNFSIEIGSFWWWIQLILVFAAMGGILGIGSMLQEVKREGFARLLGIFLLIALFFSPIYYHEIGVWSVDCLPLEFCDLMGYFAVIAFYLRNRWCYEISLYLGIIGPLQAIVTPNIFCGEQTVLFLAYYVSHIIIIVAPLYLTLILRMRPRPHSWMTTPLKLVPIFPLLLLYNKCVGSNHIFLLNPPPVNHPLIGGSWPHYLLIWMAIAVVWCFLLSQLFKPMIEP